MRIWLPGRLRCSTAWRSANDFDLASGTTARISSDPATCSTMSGRREAGGHDQADTQRAGLPHREADQPGDHQHVTAICVTSRAVGAARRAAAATA